MRPTLPFNLKWMKKKLKNLPRMTLPGTSIPGPNVDCKCVIAAGKQVMTSSLSSSFIMSQQRNTTIQKCHYTKDSHVVCTPEEWIVVLQKPRWPTSWAATLMGSARKGQRNARFYFFLRQGCLSHHGSPALVLFSADLQRKNVVRISHLTHPLDTNIIPQPIPSPL